MTKMEKSHLTLVIRKHPTRSTIINISLIFTVLLLGCVAKPDKISSGLQCIKIYKPNLKRVMVENGNDKEVNSCDVFTYGPDSLITKYSYISIEDSIMFEIDYKKDSVFGMPFVLTLWNSTLDSVIVEFEFVRPPNVLYTYYINNKEVAFKDSTNIIRFQEQRSKLDENIYLKAVFYYKGKKWRTFRRTQPISD